MITTSLEVIKEALLTTATSAQQAELCTLTKACALHKVKLQTFTQFMSWGHDFNMLWKLRGFLTSRASQIKNGFFVNELLDTI